METDPKENGDANYLNKFINRGKTYDRMPRRHIGNSVTWCVEKALNKDIKQKLIVDYKKLDVVRQYGKNNLPSSVALIEKPKMNKQEAPKLISIKKKPSMIKLINLPSIHKNLYISNSAVFADIDSIKNMCTIINLSLHWNNIKSSDIWCATNCLFKINNISYYKFVNNIHYSDAHMKFKELKDIFDKIITIINSYIEHPVLIVCDNGVNQATSVAVAYAMTEKGFTFDAAIDYIDTVKLSNYANWDSLTNTSIRNTLKLLTVNNNVVQ
jgi:hypothetical protein